MDKWYNKHIDNYKAHGGTVKGKLAAWLVDIPDQETRDSIGDNVAYTKSEADKLLKSAKILSKYPDAVLLHKGYIYLEHATHFVFDRIKLEFED